MNSISEQANLSVSETTLPTMVWVNNGVLSGHTPYYIKVCPKNVTDSRTDSVELTIGDNPEWHNANNVDLGLKTWEKEIIEQWVIDNQVLLRKAFDERMTKESFLSDETYKPPKKKLEIRFMKNNTPSAVNNTMRKPVNEFAAFGRLLRQELSKPYTFTKTENHTTSSPDHTSAPMPQTYTGPMTYLAEGEAAPKRLSLNEAKGDDESFNDIKSVGLIYNKWANLYNKLARKINNAKTAINQKQKEYLEKASKSLLDGYKAMESGIKLMDEMNYQISNPESMKLDKDNVNEDRPFATVEDVNEEFNLEHETELFEQQVTRSSDYFKSTVTLWDKRDLPTTLKNRLKSAVSDMLTFCKSNLKS